MTTNHYATAIEIIFKQEYDANAVAIQLAMQNPALFVSMVRQPVTNEQEQIRAKIVRCLGSDPIKNYVAAVKLYHDLTGSTLEDAIDYVRLIKESML